MPRSEPAGGFQIHEYEARGVAYLKVLWVDPREQKVRLLRYNIFAEFKAGLREGRVQINSGKYI